MEHPAGSNPQGEAQQRGQTLLDELNQYYADTGEERWPDPSSF